MELSWSSWKLVLQLCEKQLRGISHVFYLVLHFCRKTGKPFVQNYSVDFFDIISLRWANVKDVVKTKKTRINDASSAAGRNDAAKMEHVSNLSQLPVSFPFVELISLNQEFE